MGAGEVIAITAVVIALVALGVGIAAYTKGGEIGEMEKVDSLVVYVNSGMDKPYNQYAALVVAFTAKAVYKVPEVTVFYGPNGVEMVKKGTLAQLPIDDGLKALVAGQFEGISPEDLPDNLEQLARFEKDELGINFASCATFHVVNGFADTVDDTTNIEDFVTPVKIPDAVGAALNADKILFF